MRAKAGALIVIFASTPHGDLVVPFHEIQGPCLMLCPTQRRPWEGVDTTGIPYAGITGKYSPIYPQGVKMYFRLNVGLHVRGAYFLLTELSWLGMSYLIS